MTLKRMQDMDVNDKRVLLRLDLNVPFDEDGNITEFTRIERVTPTIDALKKAGAKVIILTHLGRPKGQVNPAFSVQKIVKDCARIWDVDLGFMKEFDDSSNTQFTMFENIRFHEGEEQNDPEFIKALATMGDVYINDAFSCAHRAHASTTGLAYALPSGAGLSMQSELDALSSALDNAKKPVIAIIGGAKVSTKLDVLTHLSTLMDTIIVGGGMANTFMLTQGQNVGTSLVEKDMVATAKEILHNAKANKCEILVPTDVVATNDFSNPTETYKGAVKDMPSDMMIMDAGAVSVAQFKDVISNAKTLIWNGPLGVFEKDQFAKGTLDLAHHVAACVKDRGLTAVAGGGDTLAAIDKAGLSENDFTYLSTAGGAFLEYCEGKELPGVQALIA